MGTLVREVWETFKEFDQLVRCKESLDEFIQIWNMRRCKTEAAGYVYPENILVLKLLLTSRIQEFKVLRILECTDGNHTSLNQVIAAIKKTAKDDFEDMKNPTSTDRLHSDNQDSDGDVQCDDLDEHSNPEDDPLSPAVELKVECEEEGSSSPQSTSKLEEDIKGSLNIWDSEDTVSEEKDTASFLCGSCDFVAKKLTQLKKHKRTVHKEVGYHCEQCNYAATHRSQLKVHVKSKHEGIRHYCDQCEHAAITLFDLKRHKRSKHEGVTYPCNLCSHVAAQLGSLIEHKKAKHEGVRYPCDQCEYAATHRSNLVKHKKSKHEGVKYLCDQCTYVATQLPKLKAHKQNKHEGITYPCDLCEYAATTTYSLKEHKRRVHEGVKFPCDQCGYIANHVSHLKEHIRNLHEGVRYPCDQCEYSATRLPMLKHHIRSKHEGVRHRCNYCGYSATLLSNLNHHIKIQHEGLRYSCSHCEYSSTRQDKLKKHLSLKHGLEGGNGTQEGVGALVPRPQITSRNQMRADLNPTTSRHHQTSSIADNRQLDSRHVETSRQLNNRSDLMIMHDILRNEVNIHQPTRADLPGNPRPDLDNLARLANINRM